MGSAPNFEEIEREKRELITSEFIERAVERGDILSQNKVELQKWLGISLYQACEFHAMGIEKDIALQHILEDRHYNKLYGKTTILSFTCSWLEDFPHIYEHLVSEHLLHVRGVDDTGRRLHWKEGNFDWKLNPQFNPEMTIGKSQGFQMKLGYFIVPLDKIEAHRAQNLSELVAKELEVRDAAGSVIGLRFFVHPEGYHHFRPLHDANIPFVKPDESEYMGTPTSSYRSLAIRRVKSVDDNFVAEDNTLPFIVKLGVLGTLFDNSRLLPRMEIEKSLEVQAAFDSLEKNDHLLIFPENLGLVLKDIPNYPKANLWSMPQVDSGLIIREFPKEFLAGSCKILSFSALMSVERAKKENNGVCSFQKEGFEALPLLFEIIDQTIKRGLVKSAKEFVQKHLIKQFFSTIEPLVFQKGLSLPLHGQNLMMVVSNDGIPLGFALRDLSDVYQNGQRYLETYTWFYRYHVFTKLFNVITASKNDLIAPPIGAPSQIGSPVIQPERSLYFYLIHEKVNDRALPILQALSLQANEYNTMHRLLDQGYLQYLKRYFAVSRAKILQNGLLPAAEVHSIQGCLHLHNQNLWKERYDIDGLEKLFQKLNITS